MLQSFFNGLSGMTNFSQGLDNVSNNISNMNTPGYRGTDVFLRSVNGQGSGFGTSIAGESTRDQPGEIRQTGNRTDLAINGEGYFVLRDDQGEYLYTRAGQFSFNEDDILVDSASEFEVMALDSAGNLTRFDISDQRVLSPEATTRVEFQGQLSTTDTDFDMEPITVFDVAGQSHTLTFDFSYSANTNTWSVQINSSEQDNIGTFDLAYGVTGSPLAGNDSIVQTLSLGGQDQEIEFDFGSPDTFNNTSQNNSGSSSIAGDVEDGRAVVGLADFSFDESGIIQLNYLNGDEEEGPRIALASISDESSLKTRLGSIYSVSNTNSVIYGEANSDQFGQVQGGSIELSNVELTQEFADMLIIQRGYQASARVMNVANELIEQLYGNR